jgi:hypothetical protein
MRAALVQRYSLVLSPPRGTERVFVTARRTWITELPLPRL